MNLKSTPFSNFQKEWWVISNVWKRRRSTPGPSHTLCFLCANMPGRAQEEISRREGRLLRVQPKMLWQMEDNVGHGEEAFQHAVRMWQEKVWARDEDFQASGRAVKREKENQEGERPECSKATNVVLLPVHERNQVGFWLEMQESTIVTKRSAAGMQSKLSSRVGRLETFPRKLPGGYFFSITNSAVNLFPVRLKHIWQKPT